MLREEHRVRVFENRVVRKIFLDEGGSYRRVEKITSGGVSYSLKDMRVLASRRKRWARHVTFMGDK